MAEAWGNWNKFLDRRTRIELKRSKSGAAIAPALDTDNTNKQQQFKQQQINSAIQPNKVLPPSKYLVSNNI